MPHPQCWVLGQTSKPKYDTDRGLFKLPGWKPYPLTILSYPSPMSSTSLDDASFILIGADSSNVGKAADEVTQVSCQNSSMNQVRGSFAVLQQPVHSSQNLSYHPGSAHSYAHDWSERGTGGSMKIDGRNLVDA